MAYRLPEPTPDTSSELVYAPRRNDDGAPFGWALAIFSGGIIAGAFIAGGGSPNAGAIVMVAAVLVAGVVFFGRRRDEGIRLRIARGDLSVFDHGKVRAIVALSRLEKIIIETRSVDRGRIVLVRGSTEPTVILTEVDVPWQDCLEWAATIRRFLRANGWTPPADERPI